MVGAVVAIMVEKTGSVAPIVEYDGRRYLLRPVDAVAADKIQRHRPLSALSTPTVPFDPLGVLQVAAPVRHAVLVRPRLHRS